LAQAAGPALSKLLDGKPLDEVAQYLYIEHGKNWVRETIVERFQELHRAIKPPVSEAHNTMTQMAWRSMFTTNFDRLVEVSYDSNPGVVRSVLPIYKVDPRIRYHDAHVVRLVKLNGSFDEAARSCDHQLVLTFNEQTSAREANADFYTLLRDEAVNGPIIFVGFSLTYPGARGPGTSPEFAELKGLLRDMGSTGRWHYCAVPADSELAGDRVARATLEEANIRIVPLGFADLMRALAEALEEKPLPLGSRPPVCVPVGDSSLEISAEEADADRRQFELLCNETLGCQEPTVEESLNGCANWGSFRDGHLVHRDSLQLLQQELQKCLREAPSLLTLAAPLGWGKTFLLRDLAMRRLLDSQPTIWLNPLSTIEIASAEGQEPVTLGSWDTSRLDSIVSQIHALAADDDLGAIPVLIADDCSERASELMALFRYLEQNHRRFVLIASLAETEFEVLSSEFPFLSKSCVVNPAANTDAASEVRALVKLCAENRVGAVDKDTNQELLVERILSSGAGELLVLALQVIFDGEHRPFEELVHALWETLDGDVARMLALRTALLHQHGALFAPRLFTLLRSFEKRTMSEVLHVYRSHLQERLLFERTVQEEPCAALLHPLVSQKLISVTELPSHELDRQLLAVIGAMGGNDVDVELLRRYLKRLNDHAIGLSDDKSARELFELSADITNADWVVLQQYTKYLLRREEPELAHAWARRALDKNPTHPSLHHTLGNVLRKWGMAKAESGDDAGAQRLFRDARDAFGNSRAGREADEYGYVTHLDMLIALLDREGDEDRRAELIAEGIQLYREGLSAVPEAKYNVLLEGRFRKHFDASDTVVRTVVDRIQSLIDKGTCSLPGALFLSDYFAGYEAFGEAEAVLMGFLGQKRAGVSLAAWTKLAEIRAREGHYKKAALAIDSAKGQLASAGNWEAVWGMWYWNMLVAVARMDYREARAAIGELRSGRFFVRQSYPRGYFWLEKAKTISRSKRQFEEHAKIFRGQVSNLRAGGATGQIRVTNHVGENLDVSFVRRYYGRAMRVGSSVRFAMEILPAGLRAAHVTAKPFEHTKDDLYVH